MLLIFLHHSNEHLYSLVTVKVSPFQVYALPSNGSSRHVNWLNMNNVSYPISLPAPRALGKLGWIHRIETSWRTPLNTAHVKSFISWSLSCYCRFRVWLQPANNAPANTTVQIILMIFLKFILYLRIYFLH